MLDTWLSPYEYRGRFQVGIYTDCYLAGVTIAVSMRSRFWLIVNLTSHGALTAVRPHRLRQRDGRVSARDPTAIVQRST
eukprot:5500560-Pleurochrysis_carterae.AAC.2